MFDSPAQQIKERMDIVEVIGSYIKLQKAGVNYRAVCPFHTEKTPSFFVSPARQIWHCFGACADGGDIFKFVMKIEGVEFGDALRILADKAGIKLKKQDPRMITERQRLYEICELAAKFFEKQLQESKMGLEAKNYLLGRGISEESIKNWRVGYAPDNWQALSDFLKNSNYREDEIVKSGIALRSESSKVLDRFRNRIIFPVFDFNSQPVGFGGRIFKKEGFEPRTASLDEAKYINTPNTLLYDKSRILYGLNKSRIEIRKKDFCVLLEGYMDAIMSVQAGVQNAVATSGTALTAYQLNILKRYTPNLWLGFDMDLAGDTATKRSIDLAQSEGFNLKIITMPQGEDPADVAAGNPEEWGKLVAGAKDIIEFYFETTFAKFGDKTSFGPAEKVEIAKTLLPVLRRIQNKILQSHWLSHLAVRLKAKEEDLETELNKIGLPKTAEDKAPVQLGDLTASKKTRQEMLEEKILTLILRQPLCLSTISAECLPYFSERTQTILARMQDSDFEKEKLLSDVLNLAGDNEETQNFLNYIALKAEMESEDEEDPRIEFANCVSNLQRLIIKEELMRVSKEIREAEESKDEETTGKLLERFRDLAKKLEK